MIAHDPTRKSKHVQRTQGSALALAYCGLCLISRKDLESFPEIYNKKYYSAPCTDGRANPCRESFCKASKKERLLVEASKLWQRFSDVAADGSEDICRLAFDSTPDGN
jgi:hypothetical protein